MWLSALDLEIRFGAQLIADLAAGGADVTTAVADAEAEVEGYISRVITLPVTVAGDALIRIGADVARYNLWRRDVPADHPAAVAYRAAVELLKSVSEGRVVLAGMVGTVTQTAKSSGFVVSSSSAVFTDARLGLMECQYSAPGASWL